jgi:hypothetical protein
VPAGAIGKMVGRTAAIGLAKVLKATKRATTGQFVARPAPRGRKPPHGGAQTTTSSSEPKATYPSPAFAGLFKDDADLSERVKDIARGREQHGRT